MNTVVAYCHCSLDVLWAAAMVVTLPCHHRRRRRYTAHTNPRLLPPDRHCDYLDQLLLLAVVVVPALVVPRARLQAEGRARLLAVQSRRAAKRQLPRRQQARQQQQTAEPFPCGCACQKC
jgi:hypothetical protein